MNARIALVISLLALAVVAAPAAAAPGESSFTPSSMLVPLHGVRLENSTTFQTTDLYRCTTEGVDNVDAGFEDGGAAVGGPDGCLIDMANPSALAALFDHAVDVKPGTYDHIAFDFCQAGAAGYQTYVKGVVELNGAKYVTTHEHGNVLTTDRATKGYVVLDYAGCSSSVAIAKTIDLKADDELTINAFFSLNDIAWASLTSSPTIGGCVGSHDHVQNVCSAIPIPVSYIGDSTPTLQTYFITQDLADTNASKAGGQMLLLVDADGKSFGGFARRLFSALSVQPSVSYDTPIKTVKPNADGVSYTINTYGGGGPGGVPIEFYIQFPAFQLETHDGTMIGGDGTTMIDYRAVKQ